MGSGPLLSSAYAHEQVFGRLCVLFGQRCASSMERPRSLADLAIRDFGYWGEQRHDGLYDDIFSCVSSSESSDAKGSGPCLAE